MGYDLNTLVFKPVEDPPKLPTKDVLPDFEIYNRAIEGKLPQLTLRELILDNKLELNSDVLEFINCNVVDICNDSYGFNVNISYIKNCNDETIY